MPTPSEPAGVLLLAYGSPSTLDEVEPYYTHIRGGRPPAPEALERLKERYRRVGGRTPLLDITRAVALSLEGRLNAEGSALTPALSPWERGRHYRVFFAMKHWHPFIEAVVPRMAAEGIRSAVAIALAPHYSRLSVGAYREAVEQAAARLAEPIRFRFVESWHANKLYRKLMAERVREALSLFPTGALEEVSLVFTAHSLPERILAWDDPYPRELRESAAAIAGLVGLADWRLAYQSAAPTGEPWLGPDLLSTLEHLAAEGRRYVLVCPVGFVADHLEVLYDLDVEASARAAQLGLTFRRTEMPNADPGFIDALLSIVAATPMPSSA